MKKDKKRLPLGWPTPKQRWGCEEEEEEEEEKEKEEEEEEKE